MQCIAVHCSAVHCSAVWVNLALDLKLLKSNSRLFICIINFLTTFFLLILLVKKTIVSVDDKVQSITFELHLIF